MLLERGPRCHTVMKTLFREVICLEAPILERGCNRLISSVCLSLPRLSVALPLSSSCSLCSSWRRKTKCCINKHLLRIELLTSMPQTCQLLCYIEHKLTVRVQWICGGNISAYCSNSCNQHSLSVQGHKTFSPPTLQRFVRFLKCLKHLF